MLVRIFIFIYLSCEAAGEVEALNMLADWPRCIGPRMDPAHGLARPAKSTHKFWIFAGLTYLELFAREALQSVELGHWVLDAETLMKTEAAVKVAQANAEAALRSKQKWSTPVHRSRAFMFRKEIANVRLE
jgi:hypothetical protein